MQHLKPLFATDRPTLVPQPMKGDVPFHDHHARLSVSDAASIPGGRLATAVS